jgi:hypothetical protein
VRVVEGGRGGEGGEGRSSSSGSAERGGEMVAMVMEETVTPERVGGRLGAVRGWRKGGGGGRGAVVEARRKGEAERARCRPLPLPFSEPVDDSKALREGREEEHGIALQSVWVRGCVWDPLD